MLVLALDTATRSVVVGVVEISEPADSGWRTPGVRGAREVSSGNRHAETLGELIPVVLSEGGLEMGDLAAVVVGLGPGPFTGLRVGVVTAAALGDALAIPVYGVCTHDAMSMTHQALAGSQRTPTADTGVVVVTDARRRECYWATYDGSGNRISGPDVARPSDVLASPDWRSGALVIGDPAFSDALGTAVLSAQPDPRGLVRAATDMFSGQPPGPLEPLYLRRPDASPPTSRKPVTPALR